ncbi:MAG TPA: bifunctional biotin--[acetyl-CoA-carboxylase] ligase/biotin operon repressor BirA [Gammaproteobacteria bacterium]|nr:bifunctional biotin--[acetyl-CoA-carboxylase] ligase/biotin operon repressor BirA [Gammaproteobacteria bacterium]
MDTRGAILQRLADGRFHSGQALGAELGLSRAAIWKILRQLREQWGLDVQSVPGRGYRLARPVALLDSAGIAAQLNDHVRKAIADIAVHWCLDSTNAHLLERTREQDIHGQVVLAEQQTAGRGRRGRQWHSPPAANLYLSLGWRFASSEPLAGLSPAVAVAVWRALADVGAYNHGIKWPNDLWWQGRKLAGILLELRGEAEGPWQVVIGIGLNVAMPQDHHDRIDQPWVDLATILGAPPDRNHLTALLINHLVATLQAHTEHGLAASLADWQKADLLRDRPVVLQRQEGPVTGIARGIDGEGALRVETPAGMTSWHAGEVSVRPRHD